MAVSSNSYFSNSVQGIPQVGADFDIFDAHATPRYAIGTRIKRQDGNEYVYSHFGADVNRGVLVATDVSESTLADSDNIIEAPANATDTSYGTINSKYIEATLASVTADQYAGGYLVTTDDTGEGYTYRVKGNTATDNPATGNFLIELYDPLQVAVDSTTDFAIQGNLYANLEIATAATDTNVAGVTVSTMDVSEKAYGWICVKGVVGILQDGTIAIGDPVQLSDSTDGAVQVFGGATASTVTAADLITEEIIGTCLIAGDTTGHGVFKVNIS